MHQWLQWAELQGFRDADAEDLSQTVLLKLMRLLPGYEGREGQTFRGWLFTICRNECRDYRQRRATRALPTSDAIVDLPTKRPQASWMKPRIAVAWFIAHWN